MLLYSIASNILSMVSLAELAAVGRERFRGGSIRSVSVAVGLSVMLKVAAGKGFLLLVEEVLKRGNY